MELDQESNLRPFDLKLATFPKQASEESGFANLCRRFFTVRHVVTVAVSPRTVIVAMVVSVINMTI